MKITTITQYEVHGEEFGVTDLKPFVTLDRARAEEIEQLLRDSASNGCLTLALSDQYVYGRDGVAYECGFRMQEGYRFWSDHFDYPASDTVGKLEGRCRKLREGLDQQNPQVALAVQAALAGKLTKLGSYHIAAYQEGIVPQAETVLVATSEAEAREGIRHWKPRWKPQPDGSFLVSVQEIPFTVVIECLQAPQA